MKKLVLLTATAVALAAPASLVAAPPVTITLQASPTLVTYGGSTTLSGAISNKRSGQTVNIDGQECGKTAFKKVGSTKTVANGAYTFAAKPTINTTYRASYKANNSPTVLVSVRPLLQLRRVSAGKFEASVTAGQSFQGKYVAFQRYKASVRRYVTVKRVTLAKVVPAAPPTLISSSNFGARVKRGTKVRISLPRSQAGTCYAPGNSRSIRA